MQVINECRIGYKYRLSLQSPVISKTMYSNIVSTQIIKNNIEVIEYVNKESTFSLDVLKYRIIIKNISTVDIENILFKGNIPNNTKFIENSFTVDKKVIRCINPDKGYLIKLLKGCDKLEICYKVLVLPYNTKNKITNFFNISYGYIYNIEKPPIIINLESNKVISKCEDKVFKQISVNQSICTLDNVCFIKKCDYNVDIIETKIINNLKPDLSTIIISGTVRFKVFYEANNYNIYTEKYIEDVFGFSTYMLVPIGINLIQTRDIKYSIEDSSINLIKNNRMLLNLMILLYY